MIAGEPWPWCEIRWAEVHAATRAGGYDPGTPAQRRAFLDSLPAGVSVEDDNETCWKIAGRWFSEFGQVTEREIEDWCADCACWPVEVIVDDSRHWALAALERCRVLQAQLDSERRHADELVARIGEVTEALGPHRVHGRPLADDVRAVSERWSGVLAALAYGERPGQVLRVASLGGDKVRAIGELRLAALLLESPIGTVVQLGDRGLQATHTAADVWEWACEDGQVMDETCYGLASMYGHVTVLEWPS